MMTNEQLIDSIIKDCNNAVRAMLSGQYLLYCGLMAGVAQKLNNLKRGMANDLKNRDETIETLKEELRNAGKTVEDMPPQEFIKKWKDGANDE